jgi:hypothetical protein
MSMRCWTRRRFVAAAGLVGCTLGAVPASAYQERIAATIVRIAPSAEQRPMFERNLDEHYGALSRLHGRLRREFAGSELEKQLRRGVSRIDGSTEKKMAKVLRDDQMEELRYLLDLIGRQFKAEAGVSD